MSTSEQPPSEFDVLLDYLKRSRGFDFTGYKRSSLERRVARRVEDVGVDGYMNYVDFLEVHPDEFGALFNAILINVTGFFRDAPAWDYLSADVIPRLLETIGRDAPVRVWSAGCASGEETYSTAMVLAEALGEKDYCERVKIYATDVDEVALDEARQASYSAKQIQHVPDVLRARYFDRVEQRYVFRADLRRTVIFGRNDLVQDAPISRIGLLTCRNTLMYFNAETQSRILNRFHFALDDRGYLFLGKSEMLVTHADLFKPVDLKRRVFTKVARSTLRERLMSVAHPAPGEDGAGPTSTIRDSAFDAAPVSQVVVDAAGVLVLVNRAARELLSLSVADVGRPLKDLELSYRPADLRSNLEIVAREQREIVLSGVRYTMVDGDPRELDVQIAPLLDGAEPLGATITFWDVTAQRWLDAELETSKRELENAYEELQSTVEELEATNEELQSTNEELETMNEELQSTNQELETINEELRKRTHELNEVNVFLETILTSLGVAVVVVDPRQTVQIWNAHAAELWGLRAEEAEGEQLLGLDVGLPVLELENALSAVLGGREDSVEQEIEATNRRGRSIRCHVTTLPLALPPGEITGAILLMEVMDGEGGEG